MKVKRILLGLLIAGLVVVGLSGVVWGDAVEDAEHYSGGYSNHWPRSNPTANVTVNIKVRTWAAIRFSTDEITLPELDSTKIHLYDDGRILIDKLEQSGTVTLVAATNYSPKAGHGWKVTVKRGNLPNGLHGSFHISTNGGSSYTAVTTTETDVASKTTKGKIYKNAIKFKYEPYDSDNHPGGNFKESNLDDPGGNYSITVTFTATTS